MAAAPIRVRFSTAPSACVELNRLKVSDDRTVSISADPPVVYYYTWDKAAAKFTRHEIAGPDEHIALGRQFRTADLNEDGRIDIVAPSKTGLWVLINEGFAE